MTDPEPLAAHQRRVLLESFEAAVARCQPDTSLSTAFPPVPHDGRLVIVAAGKAAARMARVAGTHYETDPGRSRCSGVAVVPHGTDFSYRGLEVVHAAHPLPDDSSERAARAVLEAVAGLGPDDHVVVLLSGGASSLLCAPANGISLADKRATTTALFEAGATIDEINAVRKTISAIKGGKLAQASYPARVTTLAISDVVGDDPGTIGSGPTVPSPDAGKVAREVVGKYELPLPAAVRRLIDAGGTEAGDRWPELDYRLVARPLDALQAAAECASRHGYAVSLLGDDIEGEARDAAARMAGLLPVVEDTGEKRAFLSGGEVTVTFSGDGGDGYGGPNREFALALACGIADARQATALVADTDGIDGQSGPRGAVAGAYVDGRTLQRARAIGLDPHAHLERHDSGTFFERLGDEVITGPTDTNVNDFRMLLVN